MAVTGLLGSSILTVINCGSTQWNLKKPPIILSNSGHVPTCVSRPCCGPRGAAGGAGGSTEGKGGAETLLVTLPGLSLLGLSDHTPARALNSSRLSFRSPLVSPAASIWEARVVPAPPRPAAAAAGVAPRA